DGGTTWTDGTNTWKGSVALDQKTGQAMFTDSSGNIDTTKLDGTKIVQNPDGSIDGYNKNGLLTSVTDATGHKSTYEYDKNNLIEAITPAGTFKSADDGKTFTDAAGNTLTNFKLDSSGNL